MSKRFLVIIILAFSQTTAGSQNLYFTRNGTISFFSKTPLEDIAANNNEVSSIIDFSKEEIVINVLIKSFTFRKSLMQTHFNENYMESDKFPKASFSGKILNSAAINLSKDGSYPVVAEGNLTIHGVTRQIKAPGTLNVSNGKVVCISSFKIHPEDYNIRIPSIVRNKIADVMDVKLNCEFEPYNKK